MLGLGLPVGTPVGTPEVGWVLGLGLLVGTPLGLQTVDLGNLLDTPLDWLTLVRRLCTTTTVGDKEFG